MNKIGTFTEIASPIFSSVGYSLATNEVLETVFLVLTIVSLVISLSIRVYNAIKTIKAQHDEALKDGQLTLDEIDEMTETAINELGEINEEITSTMEELKNGKDNTRQDN